MILLEKKFSEKSSSGIETLPASAFSKQELNKLEARTSRIPPRAKAQPQESTTNTAASLAQEQDVKDLRDRVALFEANL